MILPYPSHNAASGGPIKADREKQSLTNMGLKNKDGVDMKELWRDNGITTYLGMTFAGFPNTFMVYSPHGMPAPPLALPM